MTLTIKLTEIRMGRGGQARERIGKRKNETERGRRTSGRKEERREGREREQKEHKSARE